MELKNLKMKPFNTSLMGVVKGVADYYEFNYSDAFVFGATGQAFLINVHRKLCPSGPSCWNMSKFTELLKDMGIVMEDMGFYPPTLIKAARIKVESSVISQLNNRVPCSIVNNDHQIIYGFDESQLLCCQPWGMAKYPPSRLTFATWQELGDDFHVNFYNYLKVSAKNTKKIIFNSIMYAIELFESSESYSWENYGIGFDAYDNFIEAVKKGYGNSQGNWWNAKVWSECRSKAKDYLTEVSDYYDLETKEFMQDIAYIYGQISNYLEKISSKTLEDELKIKLLHKSKELEIENLENLKELLGRL
jgi:hypothetical protein